MFVEWPTEADWANQATTFPITRFQLNIDDLRKLSVASKDIDWLFTEIEINSWLMQLRKRIMDVHNTYVMAMFYYSKGIPDDPFYDVDEDGDALTKLFPNFKERDWYTKTQFDYYADVFYYKIFSAWESIGHILDLSYRLGMKKPSFQGAHKKIETLSPALYQNLMERVIATSSFQLAKTLRNDITHNYQPNRIGTGIKRTQNGSTKTVSFGIGDYTFAEVFASNICSCMEIFVTTLNLLREEASKNQHHAETAI